MLTHPGTPCVFYDHLHSHLHGAITTLVRVRKEAGVHCRSSVAIRKADQQAYAAVVEGTSRAVAVRIGHGGWGPGDGWTQAWHGDKCQVWTKPARA